MKVAELFASLSLKPDKKSFSRADQLISGVKKVLIGLVAIKTAQFFGNMIQDVAQTADQFNKMSKQIGISSEALQQLEFAAKISGSDINVLRTGLQRFARTADDANQGLVSAERAFKRMGVSVKDPTGKLKQVDVLLGEVADKFANMPDGTEKTALAMQTFGRAGAQLIPLLNEGQAGIGKLREEFVELGAQIGGDTAKQFEQLNDDQLRVKTAIQGIKNQLVIALLPLMKDTAKAVLSWVKANKGLIRQRLVEFVRVFAKVIRSLVKSIGFLVSIGSGLVRIWERIRDALGENSVAFRILETIAKATFATMQGLWTIMIVAIEKARAAIDAVSRAMQRVVGAARSAGGAIAGIFAEAKEFYGEFLNVAVTKSKAFFDEWLATFRQTFVGEAVDVMADAASAWFESMRPFFDKVSSALAGIREQARGVFEELGLLDVRDRSIVGAVGTAQGEAATAPLRSVSNQLNLNVNVESASNAEIGGAIDRVVRRAFEDQARKLIGRQ